MKTFKKTLLVALLLLLLGCAGHDKFKDVPSFPWPDFKFTDIGAMACVTSEKDKNKLDLWIYRLDIYSLAVERIRNGK